MNCTSMLENRLQQILDEKGIKKGWLAKQVGISRNTVTNLINGAIPRLDLAFKIDEHIDSMMIRDKPGLTSTILDYYKSREEEIVPELAKYKPYKS